MAKPWETFKSQSDGPWSQFVPKESGPWTRFQSPEEEEKVERPEVEKPAEPLVASIVEPVPQEQRRLGPTGPVGFGVLDLLVAPFAREKDPRLTGVARGAELLGSGLEATARVSDILPEAAPPTTPVISTIKSAAPQLQEWANNLSNWGKQFDSEYATDLGSLTENPANAVPFIIERFIGSLPDMAAATYALPAYIPALANDILNQRLENDGKTIEQATIGDVAAATAAAAIQGPLERFATRRLGEPGGVLGQTAFQAGTEAAQEVTQYAAETAGTQVGFDPEQAGLIGLEAGIVGGGIGAAAGATNTVEQNAIRRNIEERFRRGEDVRSEEELVELDRLREKAFEDAKGIVAPELPVDAEPLQFGTAYSERIYDSIGQYIPANEEFKVEEKVVDGIARFVVTDRNGTQYGQALGNKSQADALSNSLNNTTQERAKVLEQLYPLQRSLSEVMKGYGLNDVALSIDKRIFTRRGKALTSEGLFDPVVRQVFLAVDAVDPDGTLDPSQRREALRGVLRHEVVHALRYLDLWKKSEWKNLENTVSKLKKPGTDKTYLQVAQENYALRDDGKAESPVIQMEEAVAELIRDVAGNLSKVAGKPRNLSERAINFFDRAKNALTGSGFQTYEDIVRRVEEGIVGSRQRGRIRTLRSTEFQLGERGITPERIQPFFKTPEARNQFRAETAQRMQAETPATSQPAINAIRLNASRESRLTIDPVPPKIKVDDQEFPTRDSEGRLIYSGYEGPEVFGMQTRPTQEGLQNFWRSFKGSKAVDKQGRPQLYLHGTAGDITAFRPKQAGSVFVTKNPAFAEEFGFLSDNYMVSNFPDFMSDQQVLDALDETLAVPNAFSPKLYDEMYDARRQARLDVENGKAIRPYALGKFKQVASEGRSSRYLNAIQKRLPSSANIMPVYVNAQKPWDYDNKDDVKAVIKRARDNGADITGTMAEEIRQGNWQTIEGSEGNAPILDAIRELGYDSMYVEEQGEKNLAVFDPNQIKSAVGNNGNFDITTPSIRESRVLDINRRLEERAIEEEDRDAKEIMRGLDNQRALRELNMIRERVADIERIDSQANLISRLEEIPGIDRRQRKSPLRIRDWREFNNELSRGLENPTGMGFQNALYFLRRSNEIQQSFDDYIASVRELRGQLNPRSKNDRKLISEIDAALGDARVTALPAREARVPRAPKSQVFFEVAPDPNNQELTNAWRGLNPQLRLDISERVAQQMIPSVLSAVRSNGNVVNQVGSYLDDTNPSFALMVQSGNPLEISKAIGFVLSQDSMMVVSLTPFKGGDLVPAISINIGNKTPQEVEAIYNSLREIEVDGNKPVGGQTFANGHMTILNYSNVQTDRLADLIDKKLNGQYNVLSRDVYSAFPEKKDYDYASPQDDGSGSRADLRQRLRGLRAEASGLVEREVGVESQRAGDRGRRDQGRVIAPLEGAPNVQGGGPIPEIVSVAEQYAAQKGLPYQRQPSYVEVDEARAKRIADAFDAMKHDPKNPAVAEAYQDLIKQTRDQYDALINAGYNFTFFDSATDPYAGNPWNAMRDLRDNKRMAVYGTYDGYGTAGITDTELENNPLLADTGLRWPDQNGVERMVTANDLFRAVHDAFGHGIEGAGFRARGEENAWQAHARLFTGPALAALTSETRGQNSWLNFNTKLLREMVGDEKAKALHPDNWETITTGEHNRTANLKETIFSEQKTGLMPDWTWQEGLETVVAPRARESRTINPIFAARMQRIGINNIDDFFKVWRNTMVALAGPDPRLSMIESMESTSRRVDFMINDLRNSVKTDGAQALINHLEKYGDSGLDENGLISAKIPRSILERAGIRPTMENMVSVYETLSQLEPLAPRARESRVTGPASVTEPGPDTDIDTTGAAEALNEGQPVNSLGIPVGPLLTYTMPDGTVAPRARESRTGDPIRGAKIDPVMKRLIRSVEFFESAPDKLRGGVGLGDIASRIENYYDTWDARLGEVNNIIRNVTNSMSRSELRSAQDTFERYMTARENNRAQDAADIFRNATPNDRQLISAWESITNITGRVNRDVRGPDGEPIKVWDSKQKKWRPIGTIRDFFPRTLRREVMEVMMNPDLDPLLYDQLLDAVVTSGKAQTRDEAEDFLLRDYFSDEVKSDYFAGVEKARTEALPEIFYDYSWNAATRYLNKWARRTSQIEYFGQELGPFKKDWFDTNIPKIRNRETQDYLNQIKDRIYEVETFGFWNNAMKWGNQLATGLQLGNPASAFLNVVGGDVANIQMYGWREVAKAHASLLLDWRRVQEEGTKLGILNKDYLRITQDGIERDAGKYFATEDKVSVALSKFTDVALTFSGFNGAENIVRATAMLAARGFLDSSLRAINRNPNSNKSKKFIEYVKRENLDLDKLILENGAGPETDKFMRRGVNVPQGSYRIDMTPVFVDTNVGRFFFKYQKFGTQINRFFYRNFFKPWWDDKTDALKFLRLLAFLFPAIFGGEIINQFRRFLGYSGDYGPTYAQIAKAFEKDETALGWGLIISRAMQNVTVAGSFGFFGNYYQFGKDVMDQQRVKNPMSPPALSSVDALIDLGYRLYDQGQLTARDFDEIAENTMSFYRANKRIALASMSELGSEAKEVKRFVAQRDIREIRRYGLRYAQDMEIEGKRQRTSSGPPVRTEMTPTNKAIVDALYQGDSATARTLIKQALKGKNFKEKQKINQSIRASIRNRQPIQIGGSSPNNQERVAFLRWAKKNLSAEEYQKIVTMDRRYRRAAARVNMGFGDD